MAKVYGNVSMEHHSDEAPHPLAAPSGGQRLAQLGLGLAGCALLALVAAGLGFRLGLWQFRTGFTILKVAAYTGLAATPVVLAAMAYDLKTKNGAGLIMMLVALLMAASAVIVPYSWRKTVERLPRIHDISTDLDNPPRFLAVIPQRRDTDNPVEYGGPKAAAAQRQAYPDLKPLFLDLPADRAFARALAAARRLDWQIVAEVPAEGRIEATDRTFWFGFKDDIVIRISAEGNRSRVDVRSLSRVGISDVGTNARRVRAYLHMLVSLSS